MPKLFQSLIIVWTLVCVSGLGIFLFQILSPFMEPQTGYDDSGLAQAIGFFVFLWIVPVAVLFIAGRRQRSRH